MNTEQTQRKHNVNVIADADTNPDDVLIGQLVQWYDEGLRAGFLEKLEGSRATVQPIGPAGSKPHTIQLHLGDLRFPHVTRVTQE